MITASEANTDICRADKLASTCVRLCRMQCSRVSTGCWRSGAEASRRAAQARFEGSGKASSARRRALPDGSERECRSGEGNCGEPRLFEPHLEGITYWLAISAKSAVCWAPSPGSEMSISRPLLSPPISQNSFPFIISHRPDLAAILSLTGTLSAEGSHHLALWWLPSGSCHRSPCRHTPMTLLSLHPHLLLAFPGIHTMPSSPPASGLF